MALPSIFPFSFGKTSPTALAAPVEVGIIEIKEFLALLKPSNRLCSSLLMILHLKIGLTLFSLMDSTTTSSCAKASFKK